LRTVRSATQLSCPSGLNETTASGSLGIVSGSTDEANAPEHLGPEPSSEAAEATKRTAEALQVAAALHDLALQYRLDGRTEDARRVASQAEAILREHAPDSDALDEILVTLRDL